MTASAPDSSPDQSYEDQIKHLEWILAITSRLAGNSFLLKGWALTVGAASFGFAANKVDLRVTLLGVLLVVSFWSLDSYYLYQERLFRRLYREVRLHPSKVARFDMDTSSFRNDLTRRSAFFSTSLVGFYLLLVLIGLTVSIAAYIT